MPMMITAVGRGEATVESRTEGRGAVAVDEGGDGVAVGLERDGAESLAPAPDAGGAHSGVVLVVVSPLHRCLVTCAGGEVKSVSLLMVLWASG